MGGIGARVTVIRMGATKPCKTWLIGINVLFGLAHIGGTKHCDAFKMVPDDVGASNANGESFVGLTCWAGHWEVISHNA